MPHAHPFVGRKTELELFESVLADPIHRAGIFVGDEHMCESGARLENNRA